MKKESAKNAALAALGVAVAALAADDACLHWRIGQVRKDMARKIEAVAEVAETVRTDVDRSWWEKCRMGWKEKWESWKAKK